ncbi:Hypothetical protein PHPALM_4072 [Phytophthora palmivora]|uniref:DDE Tnp4 domain-containing protein n=1 Tax=Phytophthora palmivora TaxID=4796 RepID=A0A2P4YKX9_9STRA|nr:Hypothetical protein PHPALM_4072 [Phytophthora palmivora]
MKLSKWMERAREETARRSRRRSHLIVAVVSSIAAVPHKRDRCVLRRRLEWNVHKQTLLLGGQFKNFYRMEVSSFERLLSYIRPALLRDESQSTRRAGAKPISPENMLQMTISWLAGSNYQTTRCLGGTSVSAIYEAMHCVIDAICACPELRIRSPTESPQRMLDLADGFAEISKQNILTGCVGCIDGWLCERSPGKVSDSIAFKKWKLRNAIMQLRSGFYIIGDNAYPLSDSVLVPFNKLEIKGKAFSDYNFYLSQLWIRIEMAFGLLVNKWLVFKRPHVVDFVNVKKVIKTCMKLHNFCIDERIKNQDACTSIY